MRFIAQYQSVKKPAPPFDYYRTIDANDLSEAQRIAKRFERDNYRMIYLTQQERD